MRSAMKRAIINGLHRAGPRRGPGTLLLGLGLAATVVTGAGARLERVGASPLMQASPAAGLPSNAPCIENEKDGSCLPIAPESDRVDLAAPVFSNPTAITNPLFPISDLAQVIQLGVDGDESLRVEATLLPETKQIVWNGQQIEAVTSQFIAYNDGRIVEVAIDFFAQADDGSVWYLGEDVFNYEDGVVADTHGAWLAGKDGPPGMIMPASPAAGDVYRPENSPGIVFEQTTIQSAGETVDGPQGPVQGAILVEELAMDGSLETKAFAPGYGEFSADTGAEHSVVAVAVPIDAQPGSAPAELERLSTGAASAFTAVADGDWDALASTVTTMTAAWDALQASGVPPALETSMSDGLDALTVAAGDRDATAAQQAAIRVGLASLDLQLQHQDLAQVDLDRLGLWAQQGVVDAEAKDEGAVSGDVVVMGMIWDRVVHNVPPATAAPIEAQMAELRAAAESGDIATVQEAATHLHDLLSSATPAAGA